MTTPPPSKSHSESFAELPEMNPGPVCRLGVDGTIQLANAAARRIFGPDDATGRSWFDVCPAMPPAMWKDALAGTEGLQFETTIHDRDYAFTIAHREASEHVFVYGTDVTALKKAERDLARGMAELGAMARFPEMNPGPVCRVERSGTIVLANRAARQLFADDDLVGKTWMEICPGLTEDVWGGVLESTEVSTLEASVGERRLVFTHTAGADGRDIFVYGTDLTRQKAAEAALRQSDRMATLGTLAAGVAHEINNPAAAAQRCAAQLADAVARMQHAHVRFTQAGPSKEEAGELETLGELARERARSPLEMKPMERSDREAQIESWLEQNDLSDCWEAAPELVALGFDTAALDHIAACFPGRRLAPAIEWVGHTHRVNCLIAEVAAGSSRVAEIVGALRSYTYLGQAPVQDVDVNEGLKHTLTVLGSRFEDGVNVQQEFAPDLPSIHANGSELNQVWTHLMDNALHAIEGSGTVRLKTRFDGKSVIVEVEDDGPGIPPDLQPRVFDAFFTTKPPGEGTGLGLNTAYNIVAKNHGGDIRLESVPGKTVFMVSLPVSGFSSA